ncbi:Cell division protein ZapB [Vibrio aerogenes CECT 7868]|uniref:Cell division protein ZapB n=2 Tax=Vibrio aerogenes TaxID=92172 RepID=A0A1M5UF49_9VIBR|nr:Cell division protein ZapB [Vibrio aerogenes CECT 7868]
MVQGLSRIEQFLSIGPHRILLDMSFEVLEKLEAKVQAAVDTITLLQMEIEELKEEKQKLTEEANGLKAEKEQLVQRVEDVQKEQTVWQERIRGLLGKMEDVE